MQQVQFISITPQQLQDSILEGVKLQLEELKKQYQPKEPEEYLTRAELQICLNSTLAPFTNGAKPGNSPGTQ